MNKETLSTSETEKEIPKHRNALQEKYKEEAKGEPEPKSRKYTKTKRTIT